MRQTRVVLGVIGAFVCTAWIAIHAVESTSDEVSTSRVNGHEVCMAVPQVAWAAGASRACCKVCSTGKACGNTCIARWKTCRVGPGCACD